VLLVIDISNRNLILGKLQTVINRLNQRDTEYFDEQFMYGHREILLSSAINAEFKVDETSILVGGLLHGWAFDPSIWRVRKSNFRKAPRYVWHKKFQEKLPSSSKTVAIGSPWLYLLRELGIEKHSTVQLQNSELKDVLIFPGHNLLYTSKNISRQVAKYKELVGSRSATVCLYWLDYLDPITSKTFVDAGFDVVCMGFTPRGKFGYSPKGGRVTFLPRLLELFAGHKLILADELGSGVFYAASIGKNILLCPDSHSDEIQSELAGIMGTHQDFYATADAWLVDHEPALWKTGQFSRRLVEIAWEELGEESLLSNGDLNTLPWVSSEIPRTLISEYRDSISNLKSKIVIL